MRTVFLLLVAFVCLSITLGVIFKDALISVAGIGIATMAGGITLMIRR